MSIHTHANHPAIAARLKKLGLDADTQARVDAQLAILSAKERAMQVVEVKADRQPWFCSGCPHNTSTKVPEGSQAQAGIGCHFMASWMDRGTQGLIQMGGEGVDWVSHAMFTTVPHIFQNLGDGTYYHSGYLAIRQLMGNKRLEIPLTWEEKAKELLVRLRLVKPAIDGNQAS